MVPRTTTPLGPHEGAINEENPNKTFRTVSICRVGNADDGRFGCDLNRGSDDTNAHRPGRNLRPAASVDIFMIPVRNCDSPVIKDEIALLCSPSWLSCAKRATLGSFSTSAFRVRQPPVGSHADAAAWFRSIGTTTSRRYWTKTKSSSAVPSGRPPSFGFWLCCPSKHGAKPR